MYYCIIFSVIGFLFVHFFKMMRLYLVLMEHRIPFGQFVLLYLRTTLVNLIVPFKLGEIYRIEEISRKTRVWQVGILSVIVDRFFDMLALFVLLLSADLIAYKSVSALTVVFLVILVILAVIYLAIPSSFSYLNQYLIMRKSSPRAMAALKGLDVIKNWYDFTRELVSGRYMLIIFASFLGWISEIVTLKLLALYLAVPFGFSDFAGYIGAVLQTGHGMLKTVYTQMGALFMAGAVIIGYLICGILRLRQQGKCRKC